MDEGAGIKKSCVLYGRKLISRAEKRGEKKLGVVIGLVKTELDMQLNE